MKRALGLAVLFFAVTPAAADEEPKPLITGLQNPESLAVGGDGRVYVSVIGEFDKDGDGSIVVLDKGKAVPFATGLDDPRGLVAFQGWLFVTDRTRVRRIDPRGKVSDLAPARAFPTPPVLLNDIAVDIESGMLYVSDSGDKDNKGGAVYRITP